MALPFAHGQNFTACGSEDVDRLLWAIKGAPELAVGESESEAVCEDGIVLLAFVRAFAISEFKHLVAEVSVLDDALEDLLLTA